MKLLKSFLLIMSAVLLMIVSIFVITIIAESTENSFAELSAVLILLTTVIFVPSLMVLKALNLNLKLKEKK